jgi:lipid-binding SYLF domain-containing protein
VPVGGASLTQVTVGAQIGGQEYTEIIFFQTQKVLSDFKGGNFAFSGQVSSVALPPGPQPTQITSGEWPSLPLHGAG